MLPPSLRALVLIGGCALVMLSPVDAACGCDSCSKTYTIPGNDFMQLNYAGIYACPVGQTAAVTTLEVQSTDGSSWGSPSKFMVHTQASPTSPTYYPAASMTTPDSCYNMAAKNIGGANTLSIIVTNQNILNSAAIMYNVAVSCFPGSTPTTAHKSHKHNHNHNHNHNHAPAHDQTRARAHKRTDASH
jgi:hypothetical protein